MKRLVDAGADGTLRNCVRTRQKRQTPLHLATIESNAKAVNYLLKVCPESAMLSDANMKTAFQCCRSPELKKCFVSADAWRHRRGALMVKSAVNVPQLQAVLFRAMVEFL